MNDIHSFLRFALPGITSITEFMILISFSINPLSSNTIEYIIKLDLPITSILAIITIGLGFIYNLIYRSLPFMMVNYSGITNHLKRKNLIRINFYDYLENQSDIDNISRSSAWGVVNTLWHSRSGKSKTIEKATDRSEKFAHLLHNAATSLIGFVLIVALYFCLFRNFNEFFNECRVYLVFIFIITPLGYAHIKFFNKTLRDFRRFVEVILLYDLRKESKKKRKDN